VGGSWVMSDDVDEVDVRRSLSDAMKVSRAAVVSAMDSAPWWDTVHLGHNRTNNLIVSKPSLPLRAISPMCCLLYPSTFLKMSTVTHR
jgi:hypothetical protein